MVIARGCAALAQPGTVAWEELTIELAARALRCAAGESVLARNSSLANEARVSRIARMIEREPEAPHELSVLAAEARLSRYHFLRTFAQLTGLTPHQYILRARLRRAATRLALGDVPVVDVALDCGFGDVSNFNHAFRAEFGMSPRKYRRTCGIWTAPEERSDWK
jgi:AraC family transcriptional regulator